MPFERPTLEELRLSSAAEFRSRLGLDALLRRSLLQVHADVVASQAHHLHAHLAALARQLIPSTAQGDSLEAWAAVYGDGNGAPITRKAAVGATGTVRFTGTDGVVLPAGARMRRSDGAEYETDAEGTVAGGQLDAAVTASLGGDDTDADAGTVLTLVTPISGLSATGTVQAPGLSGGADEESDEDLRARLLLRLRTPPRGGSSADYVAWALELEGVTRAFALPLNSGLGTVDVTFLLDDETDPVPDQAKVDEMQAHLDARRPVTADLTVFAPGVQNLDPDIALTPDTQAVRDAVEANLEDFLRDFAAPGKTIPVSKIREAISTAAGEQDHVLNDPTADVTPAAGTIVLLGTITWS